MKTKKKTKKIKIAICGIGNVGKGLLEILKKHTNSIEISIIFDRSYKKKKEYIGDIPATDKIEKLFESSFDILVELIGGIEPALFILRESIDRKIPVVTANKSLLANHGYALFQKAQSKKINIYYEAAVIGAIPIIQNLKHYFFLDEVHELYGIFNGTTNYILTEMRDKKISFEIALKSAQEKGFAESNPTQDIDGIDSKQKLALIGSIITKKWIDYNQLYHFGIRDIQLKDIEWAHSIGYKIKLLAVYKKSNSNTHLLFVEPCLVYKNSFLWGVESENNAIVLNTKISNKHIFLGKGAGPLPTAFAVYADITKHNKNNTELFSNQYAELEPIEKTQDSFYMRIRVQDISGILSSITKLYNQYHISFAQIHQEAAKNHLVDIMITTHKTQRDKIYKVISLLKQKKEVQFISYPIPIKKEF